MNPGSPAGAVLQRHMPAPPVFHTQLVLGELCSPADMVGSSRAQGSLSSWTQGLLVPGEEFSPVDAASSCTEAVRLLLHPVSCVLCPRSPGGVHCETRRSEPAGVNEWQPQVVACRSPAGTLGTRAPPATSAKSPCPSGCCLFQAETPCLLPMLG